MSDKMEKWELQELVDEAVATGQIRPEMVNEYVYEFQQGGRVITDLTAASYHQIALNTGINTKSIEREDHKTGVLYTVIVEREGQERYGVAFEPFEFGGKFDRFCFQKALTKATRNAIKQLVSATERMDTIAKLKALPSMDTANQTPPDMLPKPKEAVEVPLSTGGKDAEPKKETEADTLRERCFALYTEHKETLGGEKFWDTVRQRFGVKSRSTMTLHHWRECLAMISDALNEAQQAKAKEVSDNPDVDGNMSDADWEHYHNKRKGK